MLVSASNIYYSINPENAPILFSRGDRIRITVDFILTASIITISTLILTGVIPLGVPLGVGTLSGHIILGSIAFSAMTIIGAVVTFLVRKHREQASKIDLSPSDVKESPPAPHMEFSTPPDQELEDILGSQESIEDKKELSKSIINSRILNFSGTGYSDFQRKLPYNNIMGGLYLGRNGGFVQTTCLLDRFEITYKEQNSSGKREDKVFTVDGKNPEKFTSVISLCSVTHALFDFPSIVEDSEQKSAKKVSDAFKTQNIEWLYLGKDVGDSLESWQVLIYNCTYTDQLTDQLNMKKEDKIRKTTENLSKQWFEPVFAKLDEAVFNGKKILVHCQAGQSRSATLLAAYLINRFNLSAEEALNFLKIRRPCVESKFFEALKTYAESLQVKIKN